MSALDWGIVLCYLAYIIYSGVRYSTKNEGLEGYYLAQRSLPWWAVGLSIMATQMSAITLVGTTGQGYADGMRFIQFYFGLPLAMVILSITVVPFFYRAKIYTAYQYLENRFDARTRTLTSFFFLLSRGLSAGVIVAAPSVVLSIVLGWNQIVTILAMGLSTTIYTMFGGVRAVTWTDVRQMIIVIAGLTVAVVVIIGQFPADVSFGDALAVVETTGKLQTVDTRFDLNETYTLWSGLIGGMFLMLSYFGCDQSQVQRYLTTRSIGEGRTSLLMSAFVKIPMQFGILLIGIIVFAFYQFQPPPMIFNPVDAARLEQSEKGGEYRTLTQEYSAAYAERKEAATAFARATGDNLSPARATYTNANNHLESIRNEALILAKGDAEKYSDVNYIFPTFILNHLPVGVIGLLIAAIFAAAMSSISSELNALSTATVIDFYQRHFRPVADDKHYLMVGRIATGFWGLVACVVAMYATQLGSLIEVVNKFGSFFYGSILGVFVLALGVRRATGLGAFVGLLVGMASVAVIDLSGIVHISFLWYNVIGCAVVVLVGLLVSMVGTPQEEALP